MNLMFGQIREDILAHPDLTPAAKLIWAALWMHWLQRENCWPTQETLANKTGLSIRAVRDAINTLMEHRLLTTVRGRYGLCYTKGPAYIDGLPDRQNLPISESRSAKSAPQIGKICPSDRQNLPVEENQEENKEEKTTSLARNGKSNGHPKRTTWKDGDHAEAIEEVIDFFLATHPKPSKLTPATRDKCGKVLDEMIRLDGVALAEARRWIGWACQDSFWQSNILSLAVLRTRGAKSGAMKWETIRAKCEQGGSTDTDPIELPERTPEQQRIWDEARAKVISIHRQYQPGVYRG